MYLAETSILFRTFSVRGFQMTNISNRIDTKTSREKLKPRREPYWHKLQKGGYLGYRCTNNIGTWLARWRNPDGSQQYESFGNLTGIAASEIFDEAQKLARSWFKTLGSNSTGSYTVKDVIDDYVSHLEINNGEKSAKDSKQRMYRHVIPTLSDTRLTKLTMHDVSSWRDSLVRISDDHEDMRKSKDGANRLLSIFKAALNLAYRKDLIGSDKAWRRVSAFKDVSAARKVFLNHQEITRLYQSTKGSFHDLVKSALLTGARYGELTNAKVSDFDPAQGTLHLSGKTGPRDCYLNDDAVSHFKKLIKNKLPTAFIHIKEDGTIWARAHQQRPMRDAVVAAKLVKETTFYALRHTHISLALLAGVNAQVIAENCGTSIRMIEKHYGKFLKSDRRAMFNNVKLI